MNTAVLTRRIAHYHDARFRAAAATLGTLSVLSLANARHNGMARPVVEDGKHGFLIDPESVPDMATALSRLFAMGPTQHSAMGARARLAIDARFAAGLRSAVRDAHVAPCRGSLPAWNRWLLDRLAGRLIQRVA